VETGVWPLFEVENGVLSFYGKSKGIAAGAPRKPVREYLLKQGRFAHFTDDDIAYFQRKIDEMWQRWLLPGIAPFRLAGEIRKALAASEAEGNGHE
jgi:pyruvate ferredoxin oxidoreductase beta subunit